VVKETEEQEDRERIGKKEEERIRRETEGKKR
jgi:hypothetical protein